jgi:AcrR family transcriptional regulator
VTASERTGVRDSATRKLLLDATMQVMVEEGYAAATSRRVAAKAGVKAALVHYYFPTMDDLYLAVFRRGAAANLERQQRALASDKPLHALWDTISEPSGTRLLLEFMGLANHRKEIRAEIAAWADRWRENQVTAVNFILRAHGVHPTDYPPVAIATVVAAIGRTIVLENALGNTFGHPETVALVERFLDQYEMPPPRGQRTNPTPPDQSETT